MRLACSIALCLSSLLAVACGGGGAPALEDLPDDIESTICKSAVDCRQFPDVQTCRDTTFIFDQGQIEGIQADVDAGIVNYDADAAERCLDLFSQVINCELTLGGDLAKELNDACDAIFSGTVDEGGDCFEDEQCAGDNATCDGSTCPGQTGTCSAGQAVADAEIGQDCTNADCVAGAYCPNATHTCAARVEAGGDCADLDACVEHTICDFDLQAGMGTCVAQVGEGETCDPMVLFGISNCLRTDNYCDATDNTCKARLDVGETCDPQASECVTYAFCDNGTCAQRPIENEACDAQNQGPRQCLGDLDCVNGTCQAPAPDAADYCPLEG